MKTQFSKAYPNIAHWVTTQGWIEIGQDEYSGSLVRALDEGGMVWESSDEHESVDEALQALEMELAAAAEALLPDYAAGGELTVFPALDSEDFYAQE